MTHPDEALLAAARTGDSAAVTAALKAGADVNTTDAEWCTPITLAALGGHLELVRELAAVPGVDLNAQNQKCFNPFLFGCVTGNVDLVRVMVEAGCELERLTRFGGNGLTPASEKGHVEVVEYLLAHTAINRNHTNTLGWTALIEAITLNDGSERFQKVVSLLVDNGADPSMTDEYGRLPIELARERGYDEIVAILSAAS